MQLLIDIGNTSIKWASCNGTELTQMRSARHQGALPIDLLAHWNTMDNITCVRACSVGPDAVKTAVNRTCQALWQAEPQWAQVEVAQSPVRIAYRNPNQLGVDRWLAMHAAHALYPGPKLIIHAGTAIVYDALRADGQHLGGLILPGIESMRTTLLSNTQIPPQESADPGETVWGANTGQCIAAACIQAPAALAERLWHHLQNEAGAIPHLILTGGDAERMMPQIEQTTRQHPDLVLRGLEQLPACNVRDIPFEPNQTFH